MARLLVKFKDRTIKAVTLDRLDTFSIGRHPSHQLVIDNYAVSSSHAVIRKIGNRHLLMDTNSTNGTFLNGTAVQQAYLKNGDVVTIGKHTLVYLQQGRTRIRPGHGGLKTAPLPDDPGPDHTVFTDSPAYRRMLVESGDPAQTEVGPPVCVAFLTGGAGRLDLVKSVVTIGRTRRCDIVIGGLFSFLAGDPAAVISKTPQHHYLSHFSGWLKPKVNGRVIRGPVRLEDHDVIKVGAMVLQYLIGGRALPGG